VDPVADAAILAAARFAAESPRFRTRDGFMNNELRDKPETKGS
jgi:hypothetical protein